VPLDDKAGVVDVDDAELVDADYDDSMMIDFQVRLVEYQKTIF